MFFLCRPAGPSQGAGPKLLRRRWKKPRRRSLSLLPLLPLLLFLSSLRRKLASGGSLSSSHHRADRRVGQVELARDVSGRVLLQGWRETGRGGAGGGVWRGRHNRESRVEKSCAWLFSLSSFSLNRRLPAAHLEHLEPLHTQVCSALPLSGPAPLRHDGVLSSHASTCENMKYWLWSCLRGGGRGGCWWSADTHRFLTHCWTTARLNQQCSSPPAGSSSPH